MGVEVGGAEDILLLLFREVSQKPGDVLLDSRRVVAGEIDRLGEPAFVEVP